jgi:hypothetical protein
VFHRQIALTRHHRGIGQHVAVMCDIHVQKTFRLPENFSVALIRFHCLCICIHGL